MKRLQSYVFGTAALVVACTPKSDSATSSQSSTKTAASTENTSTETASASSTAGSSSTATASASGTLAIELTESQIIATLGNALVSAAVASDANGASLNPGTVAIEAALDDSDECSASGTPLVNESSISAGQYAGLSAYCDLSKHPDGPDTTLGGIDRIQGIACALEPLEYDGETREVGLKVTEGCFSQTFVDMMKESCAEDPALCPDGVVTLRQMVTANKIEGASAGSFNRLITLAQVEGTTGFSYHIKLVQEEGLLAASVYDPEDEGGNGTAFSVSLSTKSPAAIRYEGRFTRTEGDNEGWRRHVRNFAQGDYDQEARTFTAVSRLDYVFWDTYLNGSYKFLSVKGAAADGFRAIGLSGPDSFNVSSYQAETEGANLCYGSGSCSGNDGITVSGTDDLLFAKTLVTNDASFVPFADWFAQQGPLAFTSVALSE